MAANQCIPGVAYSINTTGFVCSETIVMQGWNVGRYSTGADAITGAVVVDRVSKIPVIHSKHATGQNPSIAIPFGVRVKGLSCTVLMANTSVLVYVS